MRRIIVCFICFFMMLGNIKLVSADTKINSIIKNMNQDVLFVGTISHISDDYFVIIAKDYINIESTAEAIGKRTENHRYVIMRNGGISYTSSYHGKTTLEEGDYVIASLKKTKGKWIISNGLYEVDNEDYQTLSVKPCDKSPDVQSIILKYFINSDGRMNKFSSLINKNKVYYRRKMIYDARWNMKKYLTIEEIRNSEARLIGKSTCWHIGMEERVRENENRENQDRCADHRRRYGRMLCSLCDWPKKRQKSSDRRESEY